MQNLKCMQDLTDLTDEQLKAKVKETAGYPAPLVLSTWTDGITRLLWIYCFTARTVEVIPLMSPGSFVKAANPSLSK